MSDFPHENLTVSFGRLFVLAAGPGTRLPPEHVLWVRPEHSETARGINWKLIFFMFGENEVGQNYVSGFGAIAKSL